MSSHAEEIARISHPADAESLNAGLDFLWTEERMRREALMKTGIINETSMEMPSVDELLPLAGESTLCGIAVDNGVKHLRCITTKHVVFFTMKCDCLV